MINNEKNKTRQRDKEFRERLQFKQDDQKWLTKSMSFWWKSKEMREGGHKNIREKHMYKGPGAGNCLQALNVYKSFP